MKGDFTRDTFDPANHFSRVLMQQGRVQLDADWNEQAAILLHYMRTLAADLIGPYGGPQDSFLFNPSKDGDFLIGKGHYYVDGLLVENEVDMSYGAQKHVSSDKNQQLENLKSGINLVYLDVWERHLTYLEQEDAADSVISIREAALNGPDTATRTKVVWQVKLVNKLPDGSDIPKTQDKPLEIWPTLVQHWQPSNRGMLKARAIKPALNADDRCIIAPESRYRGTQNQLYRVEIHNGGLAGVATFKWSRDNGSVIFPIRDMTATSITLESLGRDTQHSLQIGDWVEAIDDDYTLQNRAEPLLQIEAIDYEASLVTLTKAALVSRAMHKHPLLRRWDQRSSDASEPTSTGIKIVEGEKEQAWIELEDGVQIQFQLNGSESYRTGDYWLIPARKATGNVEWPGPVGDPQPRPPHGVEHHYAPLFRITVASGTVTSDMDLRRTIAPLAT